MHGGPWIDGFAHELPNGVVVECKAFWEDSTAHDVSIGFYDSFEDWAARKWSSSTCIDYDEAYDFFEKVCAWGAK